MNHILVSQFLAGEMKEKLIQVLETTNQQTSYNLLHLQWVGHVSYLDTFGKVKCCISKSDLKPKGKGMEGLRV